MGRSLYGKVCSTKLMYTCSSCSLWNFQRESLSISSPPRRYSCLLTGSCSTKQSAFYVVYICADTLILLCKDTLSHIEEDQTRTNHIQGTEIQRAVPEQFPSCLGRYLGSILAITLLYSTSPMKKEAMNQRLSAKRASYLAIFAKAYSLVVIARIGAKLMKLQLFDLQYLVTL